MILHQTDTLIVCGPPPGIHERSAKNPHCDGLRAVYSWGGAWYGSTGYCECGDSWSDGELHPRPFERGWRQKAQRRFEKKWDTALPSYLYRKYTSADVASAVARSPEDESKADAHMDYTRKAIEEARLLGGDHIVTALWRARSENA